MVTGSTLAANTSGGLTFQGSGTTTLSGASTYTGGTTINAGAVSISADKTSAPQALPYRSTAAC